MHMTLTFTQKTRVDNKIEIKKKMHLKLCHMKLIYHFIFLRKLILSPYAKMSLNWFWHGFIGGVCCEWNRDLTYILMKNKLSGL